jgi:UDP-glucuronate 4-epimerase
LGLGELVALVERTVGKPATIVRQPNQPGDVPVTFANIDRARAELGYAPTTPPERGIPRYWDWLSRSGRPLP